MNRTVYQSVYGRITECHRAQYTTLLARERPVRRDGFCPGCTSVQSLRAQQKRIEWIYWEQKSRTVNSSMLR